MGNVERDGTLLDNRQVGELGSGGQLSETIKTEQDQSDVVGNSGVQFRVPDLRTGGSQDGIQRGEVDRMVGEREAVTDEQIGISIAPMIAHLSNLPTSEQKTARPRKKRHLSNLPTSGQGELRPLMPTLPTGCWWECPADDKGFKVKIRWRGGQPPNSHVFARVGKHEYQTWKEMKKDEREWTIKDRLIGELINKGKRELAVRVGFVAGGN